MQLLPEFFVQCCDANLYIDLGRQCAEHYACYGDLRPGGAYYWFSWPMRLGLSNAALIYANLFLLVISSLLSARFLLSLLASTVDQNFTASRSASFLLPTISLVIHLVLFWPTIFTALSDPPAALFFLNGAWLLGMSCLLPRNSMIFSILTGSFCIGLAAWIRAFYLYPLLLGVLAGCIVTLLNFRKNFQYLLLLVAMILPGVQLANTFWHNGNLSYLDSKLTGYWTNEHTSSREIGYDTVFPSKGNFYPPQYCEINAGLLESLSTRDYASISCIFANRLAFYLGTYRSTNYIYADIKNKLFTTTVEDVGVEENRWPGFALWSRSNLDWQQNVALDPRGDMMADKMTAQSEIPSGGTYVQQSVPLPGNTNYTFSVWLWSDQVTAMQLSFSQRGKEDAPLAAADFTIGTQPQRFSISGRTSHFDHYTVRIGSPIYSGKPVFGSSLSDSLYAWGAQLEEGSAMTDYAGIEYPADAHIRDWHPWLLLVNAAALIMALLFIRQTRKVFLLQPAGVATAVMISAAFIEALVIIPEQRFVVTCMIFIWLLAAAALLLTIKKFKNRDFQI